VGDFEAVAGIGGVPLGVLVANDSPAKTMEDLRKLIAESPGKHAYGTAFGMGTVCGETVKQNLKLDLVQVVYKSSPQALTDLAGGQIVVMCSDFNSAMGPIRNKQIRALAVTTHKRSPQLPDVPAIAEIFPGFPEMVSWVGVFAPKGTPIEISLAPAILEVTGSAEFLKTLEPNGFQRLALSEGALASFVKDELVKWETLIKKAGIQPQ
jgi:tripartite-type tricarboxylate transporter receptor subunit TctC